MVDAFQAVVWVHSMHICSTVCESSQYMCMFLVIYKKSWRMVYFDHTLISTHIRLVARQLLFEQYPCSAAFIKTVQRKAVLKQLDTPGENRGQGTFIDWVRIGQKGVGSTLGMVMEGYWNSRHGMHLLPLPILAWVQGYATSQGMYLSTPFWHASLLALYSPSNMHCLHLDVNNKEVMAQTCMVLV